MNKIISAGRFLILVLALALVALPGCRKEDETGNNEKVSAEDVKKETRKAYDAASQYTLEQIRAFREQMEARLADYGTKIDKLQKKMEILEGDARAKADKQLKVLRKKYSDIDNKLNELKDSGSDAWAKLKSGISAAMEDLGKAYKKAADELSKS